MRALAEVADVQRHCMISDRPTVTEEAYTIVLTSFAGAFRRPLGQ
jgi:hypothetical protein